jgi:hypothetical protein
MRGRGAEVPKAHFLYGRNLPVRNPQHPDFTKHLTAPVSIIYEKSITKFVHFSVLRNPMDLNYTSFKFSRSFKNHPRKTI